MLKSINGKGRNGVESEKFIASVIPNTKKGTLRLNNRYQLNSFES